MIGELTARDSIKMVPFTIQNPCKQIESINIGSIDPQFEVGVGDDVGFVVGDSVGAIQPKQFVKKNYNHNNLKRAIKIDSFTLFKYNFHLKLL